MIVYHFLGIGMLVNCPDWLAINWGLFKSASSRENSGKHFHGAAVTGRECRGKKGSLAYQGLPLQSCQNDAMAGCKNVAYQLFRSVK